jgi:hypothetical protein
MLTAIKHYHDRKKRQPSTGDCTRTSFEYFNTEEHWETEDCYDSLVDFYICENTFLGVTTKRMCHIFL